MIRCGACCDITCVHCQKVLVLDNDRIFVYDMKLNKGYEERERVKVQKVCREKATERIRPELKNDPRFIVNPLDFRCYLGSHLFGLYVHVIWLVWWVFLLFPDFCPSVDLKEKEIYTLRKQLPE